MRKLVGRQALIAEKRESIYDIEEICLKIEDRLRVKLKSGFNYCDYVFFDGSWELQKQTAKTVAQRMTEAGYYCEIGWKETTPAGNERWYVWVTTDIPEPEVSFWEWLVSKFKRR